ncbi:acyltransferase family protein [Flavobacterium channae]|uniref:acyltransferase family protein n=1 Tax=Flavobacterium channae TaxID=2897181 RepID=UPI001E28B2C5|nr:acyltransferase [Flavobacterium channae]UGS24294.1 acyltransferase [Flavobacterium channae]
MEINSEKRVFGLDVLRATAITMVVCSHILWIYPKSNHFIPMLFELFGFWGVELFFVLSGFLIGSILYKTFVEQSYRFTEVKSFLKRRWFRTLPNYYLILLLNILIAFLLGYKIEGLFKYFYFAQNFLSKSPSFFPESWSLPIEEFAYLLLPFSLWGVCRFSKNNKQKLFLIVNLFWIVFFMMNKWIYNSNHTISDLIEWNLNLKSVLIYRVDAILIGVVAAWFSINYPSWWKNNKIVFAFFASMIFAFLMFGILPMNLTIEQNPFFWNVIYLPLTSIGFAFLLPFFSEWKTNTSIFKLPIEGLSKISYSIYLIHYSIVLQLVKYFFDTLQMSQLERHFVSLATVLVTIIFSYILYKVYEKPIMNLRDK